MSFYVKDFAVIPSAQGKGVGKLLIEAMEKYIRDCTKGFPLYNTIQFYF